MPNLITLLTTFDGRINRAKWWLGFVIVMAANLLGGALLNPQYFTAEEMPPPSWPDTLWQTALLVPAMAISVKRFHDINWPGWIAPVCAGASLLFYLPPHFGMTIAPGAPTPGSAIFWLVVVVQLFGLIVNGFIIGTAGPNQYGPDPLDKALKPA